MGYILEDMTVNEVEDVLKHVKTVVLPVGIVEQHGFHLPLKTDTVTADELSKRAAGKIDAVVAPTIPYCYSGGDLTGTINVSPHVFGLLVSEICLEFIRLGFKNIVLFLGHGGSESTQAIRTSLQMLLKRHIETKEMTFSIVGAWELSKTWMDMFNMRPEYDCHAGWAETAVMMYLRPDLVRRNIVTDSPEVSMWMRTGSDRLFVEEKRVDHPFVVSKVSYSPEVKVGISGFPEKATRETGEKICMEVVEGLVNYINLINDKNK